MLRRNDRRAELADAWLAATGLSAIVAIGVPSGVAPIFPSFGDSAVVRRTLVNLQADAERKLEFVSEHWFHNVAIATTVFATAVGDTPRSHGWLAGIDEPAFRKLVVAAAVKAGAEVMGPEDIVVKALSAADAVVEKSEEMRTSGGLAEFNASYKSYRQNFRPSESDREPADYNDWLHAVRLRTAADAGAKIGQTLRFSTV